MTATPHRYPTICASIVAHMISGNIAPVAIAINIAVGSIIFALRLPIYLDSIGTVLVGALAGPWAGALTGILSNLIWSILPIPGGASPTAAFFAPVAGVIGLMAGFWASRGVFQFRSDDARAGGFLSLAAGFAAAFIALQIVQATIGLAIDPADPNSQNRFVVIGIVIVLVGVAVVTVVVTAVVLIVTGSVATVLNLGLLALVALSSLGLAGAIEFSPHRNRAAVSAVALVLVALGTAWLLSTAFIGTFG
jgi:energy-coupling factor transport system substrate-specific component